MQSEICGVADLRRGQIGRQGLIHTSGSRRRHGQLPRLSGRRGPPKWVERGREIAVGLFKAKLVNGK